MNNFHAVFGNPQRNLFFCVSLNDKDLSGIDITIGLFSGIHVQEFIYFIFIKKGSSIDS